MSIPIIVNQSTTLVQVDTSVLLAPYIVFLSNLNSPGSLLTIRDSTGNASLTNNIVISTTVGVKYLDGGGINSNIYTINQPYGFLTVTPKTSNIWGVTNTFAFPDASASANLNLLNVSSMNVSTIGYIQRANISTALISTLCTVNVFIQNNLSVGESTIAHAGFYTCSIRSLQDIIGASDIYAGSTLSSMFANITSTLTVPYISTQNVFVYGGLQTASSISTSGPMFVGSSISTTGNLGIGGSTFIQGQLTVLQAAFFNSSISTKGALNVGYETILNSSLTVASVSTLSNMTVCGSLSVMSTLYTRWNSYHESSILASGSFSTLEDVNIRRNLSTLGNVFIGKEVFTRSSMLITGAISTLHDINVRSNVSILGNLYVKGDIVFDDVQVDLQDILASSIYTQYNISTMSSLIAGGFLHVNGSTLLRGTVCTLSNFNIRGLLSTASSIIVGDSLDVFNTGFFGSNISTPSSVGIGDGLNVGGPTNLQGFLSTFGQSAFYSSMQIQGSVSVMSSIAISCNLDIGNTLNTRNMNITGSTFISTLAVTNTIDFGLNISSSTLHHGLFSTSGAMNIGGLISTTNALIVGSTINTQLLAVRSGMSVFSNAGFAQDIYARSSVIIGMSTIMRGALFTQSPAYLADALFTSNVVLGIPDFNGDSAVTFTNNGSAYIKANLTVNTGILRLSNVLQIAAPPFGAGATTNTISNDTEMNNLTVRGLTTLSNTSNTGTLGIAGITTLSNTYNTGTLDVSGVTTLANTSNTGTLGVAGLTTLSNTSNTGTLGIAGLTTLSSNLGIFTVSPLAQLDIRGGDSQGGIGSGGSNLIAFQRNDGGFRHFIRTRHASSSTPVNSNAIDFWLNNSTDSSGSSTAGTNNVNSLSVTAAGIGINCNVPGYSLDVSGTTRLNGSIYIKTNSIHYSDDNRQRFYYVLNSETRFGSANGYSFQNNNSDSIVRIDNSGNIAAVSFSGPAGTPASFPFGISGTITLANTDNSGTLRVGGATILSNTLDVSGVTTLSNSLGINCTPGASVRLDIRNSGTLPLISLQDRDISGGFRHFITSQHSLDRGSNSINFWLNTAPANTTSTAPGTGNVQMMSVSGSGIGINTSSIRARLDIQGGRNTDANSVTAIAFQSDTLIGSVTGGFRHFITTRHNNIDTVNNSNAIDFWLNRSSSATGSFMPGTSNVNSLSVTAAGIGINCNAPAYALDVSGSINCRGINTTGINTTGINTTGINTTGNVGINKSLNASFALDVSGQTTFSGRVGISTDSPSAQLDIRGGLDSLGGGGLNMIAFQKQYTNGGLRHFITTRHASSSTRVNTNAIDFWLNNSIDVPASSTAGTGNVNSFTITAAGIGINCNAPAYALDVNGTTNLNGALTSRGSTFYFGGNSNSNLIRFYGTYGESPGSYTATVIGEYLFGPPNTEKSELILFKADDGDTGFGRDRVRVLASGGFQVDINSTNAFWTDGAAPPTPLIAGAFCVAPNGNVGIGKTSPAYALDVSGTANFSGNTTVNGTLTINNGTNNTFTLQCFANYFRLGTPNSPSIVTLGNSGNDMYVPNLFTQSIAAGGTLSVESVDGITLYVTNQNARFVGDKEGTLHIGNNFTTGRDICGNLILYPNNSGYGDVGSLNYSYLMTMSPAYSAGGFNFYSYAYVRGTSTAINSSGNLLMNIVPSGRVGIGRANPEYALDVSGSIRATGDVIAGSDKRYKENIATIDSALDKVTSMRGVYFTRKESPERHVGVIAQEMEEILPEVVHTDSSEEKMKSVSYGNITAVLIEAIKEQQSIINAQQSTINGILYKFSTLQQI